MHFWNSQESQAPEESHSSDFIAIPHSGALYMWFFRLKCFYLSGLPTWVTHCTQLWVTCFHNLKSTLTTKALHYSKHCKECSFYQCCQKWSPLKGTLLAQTRELRDDCQPHWSQGLSTDSRAKAGWGNPRESPFLLFFLNHHGPVMLSEVS